MALLRDLEPARDNLAMDFVSVLTLAESWQEFPGQFLLADDIGDQLKGTIVELINPGVLTLQGPLPEVSELWKAGSAVACEDLACIVRLAMLAVGRGAPKAEDPSGLEDRAVREQGFDFFFENGLIMFDGLPPFAFRSCERQAQVQLKVGLFLPDQVAEGMVLQVFSGELFKEFENLMRFRTRRFRLGLRRFDV